MMWGYLIGALVFAAAVGGAYVQGRSDGRDVEVAADSRAAKAVNDAKADMTAVAASAIAAIQFKNTTIMGRTVHDVQTNTVYRDCHLTSDGVRDVNDALTNVVSPSVPASGVKLP
jgi:hypothetical protein